MTDARNRGVRSNEALKNILIQMYGSKDFLQNHKGFIAAEAASPVLVDAFVAFKRGWDEFRPRLPVRRTEFLLERPSDELRMLDLQIAYIHGNPNALGSKDNLDFAQGLKLEASFVTCGEDQNTITRLTSSSTPLIVASFMSATTTTSSSLICKAGALTDLEAPVQEI